RDVGDVVRDRVQALLLGHEPRRSGMQPYEHRSPIHTRDPTSALRSSRCGPGFVVAPGDRPGRTGLEAWAAPDVRPGRREGVLADGADAVGRALERVVDRADHPLAGLEGAEGGDQVD